jgi:hypothetical protein
MRIAGHEMGRPVVYKQFRAASAFFTESSKQALSRYLAENSRGDEVQEEVRVVLDVFVTFGMSEYRYAAMQLKVVKLFVECLGEHRGQFNEHVTRLIDAQSMGGAEEFAEFRDEADLRARVQPEGQAAFLEECIDFFQVTVAKLQTDVMAFVEEMRCGDDVGCSVFDGQFAHVYALGDNDRTVVKPWKNMAMQINHDYSRRFFFPFSP